MAPATPLIAPIIILINPGKGEEGVVGDIVGGVVIGVEVSVTVTGDLGDLIRYGSVHTGQLLILQQKLSWSVAPQQPKLQRDTCLATLPLPLQFHKLCQPQSLPKQYNQ